MPPQQAVIRFVSQPLLQTLETGLRGIKTGRDQNKVAVTAYADDVTAFLNSPADGQKLQEILHTFKTATSVRDNRQKSRALARGGWDLKTEILDIFYQTDVKILGLKFTKKVHDLLMRTGPLLRHECVH
jgi:hypothetical protein